MEIKTSDGIQHVASQGVGTAGLTLGIIGTSLAALNGANGGGLLSGLFNGGGSYNQDSRLISALEAELTKERAKNYSDQGDLAVYNALFNQYKELSAMSTSLDKRVSAIEVASPLREQLLQQQISCCCNSANAAISALQQTVQGITKTVIPITAVCPQPMPEHNSWTAPTTTTSDAA